jgi:hypothetical protein
MLTALFMESNVVLIAETGEGAKVSTVRWAFTVPALCGTEYSPRS